MSTTLSISDAPTHQVGADVVIIAVIKGTDGPLLGPGAKDVDEALAGRLAETLTTLGATGQAGEITKVPAGSALSAPLVIAVGIGPLSDSDAVPIPPETLRRAAGAASRAVLAMPALPGGAPRRAALALPSRDQWEAEAVALGALLGCYEFRRYRRDGASGAGVGGAGVGGAGSPSAEHSTGLSLILLADKAIAEPGVARAEVLARAVTMVRDLVNTSPSHLTPMLFTEHAERVAKESGLEITVLDEHALAEGSYGGILGVGQGSAHPPRLIRLEYSPAGAAKTLVLAGKGITFDSGGLSLKPSKSMETMKSDMSGAAAVLGAMQAISALGAPVHVVGYLPLAENMPSGSAQHPSDVITIHDGTTVEVLNTDAEGRLVLADALASSAADSPDLLIDVATLTGSQIVALGPLVAGVMSNDDSARDHVVDAAARAGEAMWPMPLPEELRKGLESSVADLTNVAPDRNGGMLVAGLFLREFVPDGVRWAHLDIAGPAFNEAAPHGYTPKGGTGAATRTLIQIALDMAEGRL